MKNLFAERFSELLEQHLWSYEELAKKLGLKSKGTICKYAKGTIKNPNISIVSKIASLYQVSPAWLIGLNHPKTNCSNINESYSLVPAINTTNQTSVNSMIISNTLLDSKDYMVFKCEDSSMSPLINIHDLLLIESNSNPKDGDICLISKSEIFYIRKFSKIQDEISLIPINSTFSTDVYSINQLKHNNITIWGIVRKLERNNF